MNVDKLFKVIVVGGALMTSAETMAFGHLSLEVQPEIKEELSPTFCNPEDENQCVENEEGEIVVKEGFYCCWGTSCSTEE
ncbi:MAG: hypothetical protein ACJAT2_001500 [Bacteriovoracaceae bacterium]|jgi:hypothetical protein